MFKEFKLFEGVKPSVGFYIGKVGRVIDKDTKGSRYLYLVRFSIMKDHGYFETDEGEYYDKWYDSNELNKIGLG